MKKKVELKFHFTVTLRIKDIEISERQIETGQIKDAREALKETKAKYGL